MKSKMSQIGIGLAALSALAAEGKDFNRAELNAMLDKLAASPEPKVRRGPAAMCYSMAMPRPAESVYKCPKCGAVTKYFSGRFKNTLAFYRDGAVQLNGMGLDISLDESSLCRVCTPGKPMPISGYCKSVDGEVKKVRVIECYNGKYNTQVIRQSSLDHLRKAGQGATRRCWNPQDVSFRGVSVSLWAWRGNAHAEATSASARAAGRDEEVTTILPSVAVLEMTYRCNHACRFCSCPWFAGMLKPGPEMEIGEWKRLIDTYASAGVTQFSFTGGEALLKEGCLELMDFASKRAQVGLLSNGRAMTEDVLRFCAERGIHVLMSMPGLRSFAANTDSDTSVEHILSMFGKAHELGCATTVGIAVTKLNLPELYETISAALVAGADSLLLNRFLPGGRGLSHPELMLTADDVRHAADVAEEVLSRAKRHGHFGTELPDCMIDAEKYEYLNVTTGCSAATDFFTVGPNGRIRVCNHSPVELVKWDEWERLPECEEWMHYVRHDYLPKMCDGCDKAAKCLGGCREAARVFGGSPTAPDPVFEMDKKV